MKPDTTLTLQSLDSGDVFEFARFEIPEQIPFGGEQRLNVHELVGGVRVIDAMGATPMPVEWSGQFVGDTALERALYIDGLRKAGKPLYLSWDELAFTVVIKSFHCEFKRFYRLPYRVTCEVVEDLTTPVDYIAEPSIDQLITDDMNTANGLASGIGDGTLSSLMGTLNSAISAVSSFAAAAQSTLNSVLQPIAAVRAQVGILIQATNGAIQNVTTLGGILPGNPVAQQANKLLGQINAVNQSPNLINLDRVLGRMQSNIGTINSGTRQVPVAGGNLYSVAANQYGDAMGWTAIAQANGLKDPQVNGLANLTIPPYNNQTDGVLNA
jgi:hypothetical protein